MDRAFCQFIKKFKKELFPITILMVSIFTCHKIDSAYDIYRNEIANNDTISNNYADNLIKDIKPNESDFPIDNPNLSFQSNIVHSNKITPTSIKKEIHQLRGEIIRWKKSKKHLYSLWNFE